MIIVLFIFYHLPGYKRYMSLNDAPVHKHDSDDKDKINHAYDQSKKQGEIKAEKDIADIGKNRPEIHF